jgi:hypothetical protein
LSDILEAQLTARSLVQSNADSLLSILDSKGGAIWTMFYVDDGMVAACYDEGLMRWLL